MLVVFGVTSGVLLLAFITVVERAIVAFPAASMMQTLIRSIETEAKTTSMFSSIVNSAFLQLNILGNWL